MSFNVRENHDTSSNLLCNLLNYQAADLSVEINSDFWNCEIFIVFVVSHDLGNSGNLLFFPHISTPDLTLRCVHTSMKVNCLVFL